MDTGFQNWGENQPSHTEYVLHYFVLVLLTKYFQLTKNVRMSSDLWPPK